MVLRLMGFNGILMMGVYIMSLDSWVLNVIYLNLYSNSELINFDNFLFYLCSKDKADVYGWMDG